MATFEPTRPPPFGGDTGTVCSVLVVANAWYGVVLDGDGDRTIPASSSASSRRACVVCGLGFRCRPLAGAASGAQHAPATSPSPQLGCVAQRADADVESVGALRHNILTLV